MNFKYNYNFLYDLNELLISFAGLTDFIRQLRLIPKGF